MGEDAVIPPAARLLRDFVNTYEPQENDESLTSATRLRDWFAARELLPAGARLRSTDLALALTIREGLRAVLLGHAGHDTDPDALDRLDAALAQVPLRLAFGGDGPRLVGNGGGPAATALAGLADAVRRCGEDGSWPRLKVCARDTCRWAYYDASRNQARRWCSMSGCGNWIKMRRAYATRTGRGADS
ncbi:CGNR zinc finger domain-containing protein [Micromonospora sp. NPDC000089]|uniref:CGNR zinc finger domain-containing protein n=1 Tax=unclassified Micromonospora TaxID=2617518 RepID=UPI00367F80E3